MSFQSTSSVLCAMQGVSNLVGKGNRYLFSGSCLRPLDRSREVQSPDNNKYHNSVQTGKNDLWRGGWSRQT